MLARHRRERSGFPEAARCGSLPSTWLHNRYHPIHHIKWRERCHPMVLTLTTLRPVARPSGPWCVASSLALLAIGRGNELECPQANSNRCNVPKMLNKLGVSQVAELSNLSKAYISQVKNGRRPPSEKLVQALQQFNEKDGRRNSQKIDKAISLFLKSRRDGVSPNTITFYKRPLEKAIQSLGLTPTPAQVNAFINSLSCSLGGKHAY